MQNGEKWYYCPRCGNKVAKYDPLQAICSAVYVKCRLCKNIVEIKCKPKPYKTLGNENIPEKNT
ncbi:MAG: hypothetical protein NC299_11930 [Lachnospiraceae bacterium]|nr:hypothetical protein [Lachnospiraceae bacterium]